MSETPENCSGDLKAVYFTLMAENLDVDRHELFAVAQAVVA